MDMNSPHPIPDHVREILAHLPAQPGVYFMKDAQAAILYVGKAKRLKQRVRSYFRAYGLPSLRIAAMVAQIADIEYIVTDSELEALILEATLIKKHLPPYNVVLKDDKNFPYITLTIQEEFPRIFTVRKFRQDGALYFGPFVHGSALQKTLGLLKRFFPLRLCAGDITYGSKARPCFEYEIHRCLAPCAGKCAAEEYRRVAAEAQLFLQGKKDELIRELRRRMEAHADALEFEKAAAVRDEIEAIARIMERQKIISTGLENQDVIAAARKEGLINAQLFFIRNGVLMGRQSFSFAEQTQGDATRLDILAERDVLRSVVEQFYLKDVLIPDEILLPDAIPNQQMIEEWLTERKGKKVSLIIPQRGRKKRLVEMARQNAEIALSEHENDEAKAAAALQWLEELKAQFHFANLPRRIECFDISNIQGTLAVGSMVVCVDGVMQPKEYKRFRIKTIEGSDDFGMMQEVVTRRYARVMNEGLTMPDVIMVDGGKGQLHAAKYALALIKADAANVIGIAKAHGMRGSERDIERIFTTVSGDGVALDTSRKSAQLLMRIRDEAHRFAITYHRKLRKNANLRSRLDEIPGIGAKRRKALLTRFGSVKKLQEATPEEIAAPPTMTAALAETVHRFLRETTEGI